MPPSSYTVCPRHRARAQAFTEPAKVIMSFNRSTVSTVDLKKSFHFMDFCQIRTDVMLTVQYIIHLTILVLNLYGAKATFE